MTEEQLREIESYLVSSKNTRQFKLHEYACLLLDEIEKLKSEKQQERIFTLEEAAKICEERSEKWMKHYEESVLTKLEAIICADECSILAEKIRDLKEDL